LSPWRPLPPLGRAGPADGRPASGLQCRGAAASPSRRLVEAHQRRCVRKPRAPWAERDFAARLFDMSDPSAESDGAAEDTDGKPDALFDELKKVRNTLRGNVVPEARKLVSDHAELTPAPLIWILAAGSWYDHLALGAVGGTLQKAGFRVKVFGAGVCAGIFSRLGLSFEAHDARPPLHRNNRKAREWLNQAWDHFGLAEQGGSREEEMLMEIYLLRQEYSARLIMKMVREGKGDGFAEVAAKHERRFNDFFIRSDTSDAFNAYVAERFEENNQWRALERRISVQHIIPVRKAHCKAFRGFIRQKAKELRADPIDVVETLRNEFSKRLVAIFSRAAKEGREAAPILIGEVSDFLKWHAGESPREWWDRWVQKLPAWEEQLALLKRQHMIANAMENVTLSLQGTGPEERPQLVLYKIEMASLALMLEARLQTSVAAAWPWLVPESRSIHALIYNLLVTEEQKEKIPLTPLADMGPVAFSDMIWSSRQISGQTSLRLKDEMVMLELRSSPLDLQAVRSCSTGLWTVDGDLPLLPSDDPILFGSPDERELAKRFLEDSSDPPICLGWGKKKHPKGAEALVSLVCETVRLTGRRGIFLTGLSGASLQLLRAMADKRKDDADFQERAAHAERQILFLRSAPHGWLLPRCACVVHHGGHGTVQTALHAGLPQVMMPPEKWPARLKHNGDFMQFLGCGVDSKPLAEATPEVLAEAVRFVLGDVSIKAKAAEVAKTVRKHPGALGAVALVGNLLHRPAPPPLQVEKALPWVDGLWGYYVNGSKKADVVLRGKDWYSDAGASLGSMRVGCYRVEQTAGLPKGCTMYTVQVFWWRSQNVGYGTVSDDGKKLTWADCNHHKWEGEAPPPADADKQEHLLSDFSLSRLVGGFIDLVPPWRSIS